MRLSSQGRIQIPLTLQKFSENAPSQPVSISGLGMDPDREFYSLEF
ncbi:hypothetical protein LEP1GSC071_2313 [Leptospira santarosai str. JET]|nr:hypothetical protein LEP1GSC071_2313 [Leptospira santarosai str. JET]